MSQVYTVRINFEINTSATEQRLTKLVTQVQIVERMLVRTLAIIRRISGNESLNKLIMVAQRAIMVVNQLQIASSLLMATNPWLWGLGLLGIIGTSISLSSTADIIAGY